MNYSYSEQDKREKKNFSYINCENAYVTFSSMSAQKKKYVAVEWNGNRSKVDG